MVELTDSERNSIINELLEWKSEMDGWNKKSSDYMKHKEWYQSMDDESLFTYWENIVISWGEYKGYIIDGEPVIDDWPDVIEGSEEWSQKKYFSIKTRGKIHNR